METVVHLEGLPYMRQHIRFTAHLKQCEQCHEALGEDAPCRAYCVHGHMFIHLIENIIRRTARNAQFN
jgi:hypothetical protein